MLTAVTRAVGPGIARCELTHLVRAPIDYATADAQHRAYEQCLVARGCELVRLPAEPELPDSVFVEDVAVVLDELAVITRPGAESRRPESPTIAEALRPYRPLAFVEPPGTLDGGDVLRVERKLFVGLSARTSVAGIAQLARIVGPLGYEVTAVEVGGCLHLKSAATLVAPGVVLVNPRWLPAGAFGGFQRVEVDPAEPHGANALRVGEAVVYPAACPRTRERLERHGVPVISVDVSELAKAEGGVTCCSLIFSA